MKKTIILILMISMLTLGIYGCTGQETPSPADPNNGVENGENVNPEEDQGESPQQEKTEDVTLYFGDESATYVAPETRDISLADDVSQEEYIKLVVEELIKGPETEKLNRTIPPEVKVNSVKIENNIAYIDFSEEMHTKHWGGATGESMTINSIVNTLTELDDIDKVGMTVEGEPLSIEHAIMDEPVERNEEMIQK